MFLQNWYKVGLIIKHQPKLALSPNIDGPCNLVKPSTIMLAAHINDKHNQVDLCLLKSSTKQE